MRPALRAPLPHADRRPGAGWLLQNATSRAANKRRTAFKNLRTPWEESFAFTSAARRQINPATLRRIVELNAADQGLWDLGDAMLTRRLEEHRAAGTLQELPKPKEPEPQKADPPPPVDPPIDPEGEAGADDDASAEEEAGDSSVAPREEAEEEGYDEGQPPSRAKGADGSAAGEDDGDDASGDSVADGDEIAHEEL